jgi:hypothetical protein
MSSGTGNTTGDFLQSILSTLVNKDDEVFKALIANPEETGAIETIFNELETVRDEWCNNSDVYNQIGEMLEKTLAYFSVLERLFEENDESFKARNELLFYRNGDSLWGDKWDILGIFKRYFNTDKVFIVNDTNPINENLFLDGDFEEGDAWILENCVYDKSARFSNRFGILFNIPGSCRQDVDIERDTTYFIHFFLDGHIGVKIKDNNNRYWDIGSGEFGEWVNKEVVNNYSTNQWDAVRMFFLTDDQANKATISFTGIDDSIAMLDYVRLFKKGNYSSFTLIANFTGLYTADTMSMAPGQGDPVRRQDYSKYGYFSAGKHDRDPINYDNLSFFEDAAINGNDKIEDGDRLSFMETAALNEDEDPVMANENDDRLSVNSDKDPVMAGGKDDVGETEGTNASYIADTPLAPGEGDDDGEDVNYEGMSYIEQANLFGTDTVRPEGVYTELLEIVKAGGISSYIEILVKETE